MVFNTKYIKQYEKGCSLFEYQGKYYAVLSEHDTDRMNDAILLTRSVTLEVVEIEPFKQLTFTRGLK